MFLRKHSSRKPHVIWSYCMKCSSCIGASILEDAIDAIEKKHQCSQQKQDPPADIKPIRIRRKA